MTFPWWSLLPFVAFASIAVCCRSFRDRSLVETLQSLLVAPRAGNPDLRHVDERKRLERSSPVSR